MSARFSRDGFVLDYIATPVSVLPYESTIQDPDQLQLEKRMRQDIVTKQEEHLEPDFLSSRQWEACYSHGNIFLDRSAFYSTPQRISYAAATALVSDRSRRVDLALWTYMAVGVYLNGKLVLTQDPPCYKPIRRKEFTVTLEKGTNVLVIKAQTLGVRDTNSLVGLQVLSDRTGLSVALPDREREERYRKPIGFLDGLRLDGNTIQFPFPAPQGTTVRYCNESPEYRPGFRFPSVSAEGAERFAIEEGHSMAIVSVDGLSRTVQAAGALKPVRLEISDDRKRYGHILHRIAEVGSLDRGDHGIAMFNILARKKLGLERQEDRALFLEDLHLVEQRVDCSDFILLGLFRYLHNYELDEQLAAETKRVLLGYRYWMDMDGQDGMCFWSENHSLIFYLCAFEAGRIYPDEYFPKAKMCGSKLQAYGRERLSDWLDDVLEYGFEEFLSTVYMCVTFAALLNVYDFGEEPESGKAQAILDRMADQLATQVFDGAVIAPMARVYRDCIFPFRGGANSILALATDGLCYDYAEGWTSFYATSGYRFKEGIPDLVRNACDLSFTSGNARIYTKKNDSYMLTSVASPREDHFTRWENVILDGNADPKKHTYTKSMNEKFHGTSCFKSGCLGYQQHLWYAALSSDAVFFVNHPGTSAEQSGHRPGYWYGNGIFPALKQEGSTLGGIYSIPESHPIHFVHAYLPAGRFDQVIRSERWTFCRKGSGYLAFWCSAEAKTHDDMLFGCEVRYEADRVAFFVAMGSEEEDGPFDSFVERTGSREIRFEFPTLRVDGRTMVGFRQFHDESQTIE